MSDAQYQTALALYGQGRHDEAGNLLRQAAQGGHAAYPGGLAHFW